MNFPGAQIGGNLECIQGTFANPTGTAFNGERINVKGSVFLRDGFAADGEVELGGAQMDNFNCANGNFEKATLNLTEARAVALYDSGLNYIAPGLVADSRRTMWPQQDKLLLDGFVYARISSEGQINVNERLKWLGRQPKTPFRQQPYLQMAKVLRESGDSDGSLDVLGKMEELRRSSETHDPIAHFESWVFKSSIGYGYYPARAIWEIIGLSALGWIIYRRSYLAGGIAPTEKEAYKDFKAESAVPSHYPSFSPLVYSVENSLPLVKLGQAEKWQPDPEPQDHSAGNIPAPKLGHRGMGAWPPSKLQSVGQGLLRRMTAAWIRVPRWIRTGCTWTLAKLDRLLVLLGLRPKTDPQRPTPLVSRFATSPRFVMWFLWIQILLG